MTFDEAAACTKHPGRSRGERVAVRVPHRRRRHALGVPAGRRLVRDPLPQPDRAGRRQSARRRTVHLGDARSARVLARDRHVHGDRRSGRRRGGDGVARGCRSARRRRREAPRRAGRAGPTLRDDVESRAATSTTRAKRSPDPVAIVFDGPTSLTASSRPSTDRAAALCTEAGSARAIASRSGCRTIRRSRRRCTAPGRSGRRSSRCTAALTEPEARHIFERRRGEGRRSAGRHDAASTPLLAELSHEARATPSPSSARRTARVEPVAVPADRGGRR